MPVSPACLCLWVCICLFKGWPGIMTLNESVRANDKELKAHILVYQDRHERIGEGLTMDRTIRRSFLWPSIGYLSVPLKRDKH